MARLPRARRRERGSALVVVFILLTLIMAFSISNQRTLTHLKRELQLIERKQQRHWTEIARQPSTPSPVQTKAPPPSGSLPPADPQTSKSATASP